MREITEKVFMFDGARLEMWHGGTDIILMFKAVTFVNEHNSPVAWECKEFPLAAFIDARVR